MLAALSGLCNKKPAPSVDDDAGQGQLIATCAPIRKGQAFQSPIHPNREAGNAAGDCVSPGRLTAAGIARGSCGIAEGPTVKRKLDAGRKQDRLLKNQQTDRLDCHVRVYKRRIGSEVYRTSFPYRRLAGASKKPFAAGRESYVYRSEYHQGL